MRSRARGDGGVAASRRQAAPRRRVARLARGSCYDFAAGVEGKLGGTLPWASSGTVRRGAMTVGHRETGSTARRDRGVSALKRTRRSELGGRRPCLLARRTAASLGAVWRG
jgi:hypothetical protein